MTAPDWDERYRDRSVGDSAPVAVLSENQHLLPHGGVALDVACGLGANAIFLAQLGMKAFAWDTSPVAVEKVRDWSRENLLPVTAEVRDLLAWPPEPGRFDVIVVGHFLERALCGAFVDALSPGGLLFYQTFTQTRVSDRGPSTDRYRLADNELLDLFGGLHVLFYREEGRVGDLERGFRDEAQLVARKPG